MIGRISAARRARDEGGSILVLTTLLMPALVAIGAVAVGATTLWTSHLDAQRGVDLAALAAAANVPTASVTPGTATTPVPVDGIFNTRPFRDTFDPTDWKSRACAVLQDQLTGGRSKVFQAAGDAGDQSGCDTWITESPTLAAMAACAGDLLDVPGCADTFRDVLNASLPLLTASQPDVTRAMNRAEVVATNLTNTADEFLSKAQAEALQDACLVKVLNLCTLRLADRLLQFGSNQLAEAGLSPTGDIPLGVDLNGLLPAIMTPRVRVDLQDAEMRPMLSPFTFGMTASATARRAIKSAVVLPSLGIPGTTASATVDARLGTSSAQFLLEAGTDGFIVDPNDLTRAANAVNPIETILDAVDGLNDRLMTDVIDAFTETACQRAVVSRHCPQIDGVVATDLVRDEFQQDLQDATAAPPRGSEPRLEDILQSYADSGESVWAVAPLRRQRLDRILAEAGLSTAELDAIRILNPSLDSLFSAFVFIPALDVVPVTVSKIDPNKNIFTLRRTNLNDVTATSGLYQARLVK